MIRNPVLAFPLGRFAAAWLGLGLLLATGPAGAAEPGDQADAHLLQAEIALQRDDYKLASREYRKAAEETGDVEIARQATQVSYTYGFDEDALGSAERWAKLDPASDEALLFLAQLQLRNGKLRDSRKSFREPLSRGDHPADERLVSLIPPPSEEAPTDGHWPMKEPARNSKDP